MSLVTHQLQGSYAAFPSRPLPLSRVVILKRCKMRLHVVGKADRYLSLRCHNCLRVVSPHFATARGNLRVSSFKGSAQNDESSSRGGGSTSRNSIKVSYLPKEGDDMILESPKAHHVPVSYTSEPNGSIAGSPVIRKLFTKWLTMLRTRTPDLLMDKIPGETMPKNEVLSGEIGTQIKERSQLIKVFWCHFWDLDATIKIPLMIFVPLYLAINVTYGSEVSKELTPLWILGPLFVALYVKLLQGLFALYVFTFKQTVNLVKNLPVYYSAAYEYVAKGKLKEDIYSRFWQPIVDFRSLNYKVLARRKIKELQEWLMEKYLDFVESIWPYYCRTIRFLKRANLI